MEICSASCDGAKYSLSYVDHQFIIQIDWYGDFPDWLDVDRFYQLEWTTNQIDSISRRSKLKFVELDEVSVFEAIELLRDCSLIAWDNAQAFAKCANQFLNLCCK